MASKVLERTKSIASRLTPNAIARQSKTRRAFMSFADELDMVCFGTVDQSDDEHKLLRGLTASLSHQDSFYSVGTYKGYDIATALRRDHIRHTDKRIKQHHWAILTVDLHTECHVPEFFVLHHAKRDLMLAKFAQHPPVQLGVYTSYQHDATFLNAYGVYAMPSHAQGVDMLLTPEITQAFALHFKDMSIELSENTVYTYVGEQYPTKLQLQRMLNAGVWFAQLVDQRYSIACDFVV